MLNVLCVIHLENVEDLGLRLRLEAALSTQAGVQEADVETDLIEAPLSFWPLIGQYSFT